jgi:NAD(P)-dependent dehydrogenase (short-subunit alcohol dehydrogenase family)
MRNPAKAPADLDPAATVVALDVDDDASVRSAVASVLEQAGRIDVLVNNAGFGLRGPVEQADLAAAKRMFETNVFGVVRMCQAVLPGMREQRDGVIVNVSSLAGVVANPFGGLYAASKHAVEAISDTLHYEVHPWGIRVVLVEPGSFETRFDANAPVSAGFDESSPYWSLAQGFNGALDKLRGDMAGAGGADPQLVADAIWEAATDPSHPRRRLVGTDAEMIGGLRKQLDDEQFEQTVRQALDFWD